MCKELLVVELRSFVAQNVTCDISIFSSKATLVVGCGLGTVLGLKLGATLGIIDGMFVGASVGSILGTLLGDAVGPKLYRYKKGKNRNETVR